MFSEEYYGYEEDFVEETEAPFNQDFYQQGVTGPTVEAAFKQNGGKVPLDKLHRRRQRRQRRF